MMDVIFVNFSKRKKTQVRIIDLIGKDIVKLDQNSVRGVRVHNLVLCTVVNFIKRVRHLLGFLVHDDNFIANNLHT